jgi:hypothetical protein
MYMKIRTNGQITERRLWYYFLRINELSIRYFKLNLYIRIKLLGAMIILSAYSRGKREESFSCPHTTGANYGQFRRFTICIRLWKIPNAILVYICIFVIWIILTHFG